MTLSALLYGGKVDQLTSFFSLEFLAIFFPAALLLYSVAPKKSKPSVLLAESYVFVWLISGKLIIYLLLATLLIHYCGLWLDRLQNSMRQALAEGEPDARKAIRAHFTAKQRGVIALAAALLIGTLLALKYSAFFTGNVNTLLSLLSVRFQLKQPQYLLPIGISFFTLQALSYLLDVYRGTTKTDDNLPRLALFLAFFPQIVEGPICRYHQTANALWNAGSIRFENLTLGLQRILFGILKKIVIADRLDPLVKTVFSNHEAYDGALIAIAAVCYTIQLYMDFSGAMDTVLGTAQIFGVSIPENFARPFFSKTISEFWMRWHITLGTWFKDYVFYPITASKGMKKLTKRSRKTLGNHYGPLAAGSVALFCVWFCNGLWHGAAWNYLFFGMYHFALILGGSLLTPVVRWLQRVLHIDPDQWWYRTLQMLRTTVFVIIGELFFRAHGLLAGLQMFKCLLTDFSLQPLTDETWVDLGVDRYDLWIVAITLVLILIVSICNEKGVSLRDHLSKKKRILRWAVLYALIAYIVVFGAYGFGYAPVDPLYAQF